MVVIPIAATLALTPWVSAPIALLTGSLLSLSLGNPYLSQTRKLTHKLLPLAVIGLGAGMDLGVVARVGLQGIGYTVVGIMTALILGTLLGRVLRTPRDTSILISVGTAICGGSAIAAVAPTLKAKDHEISVALGTVFVLNAVALLIFPSIGRQLDLNGTQFGLWSALAIHDTSSVVGATLQYGSQALQVGTTVKLARALWIAPIALACGYLFARGERLSAKIPWFIAGFLITAALVTWLPHLRPAGHLVETVAKRILVLTLFLVGINLTPQTLKAVGIRPFVQGVVLWVFISSVTLAGIFFGYIPICRSC